MRGSGQLEESLGCLASLRRYEGVWLARDGGEGVWPAGGEFKVFGQLEEI